MVQLKHQELKDLIQLHVLQHSVNGEFYGIG